MKTHRTLTHALASFRSLWSRRQRTNRHARRQAFLLEHLEDRRLMASDAVRYLMGLNSAEGESQAYYSQAESQQTALQSTAASQSQAEGEAAADLVGFAKALTAAGVKFYGAIWCPHCNNQKALFQDGARYLNFIEVTNPDHSPNAVGTANNISSYPTWEFADGSRLTGEQTLEALAAKAGIAIPTSSTPSIAPIGNQTVLGGAPLWIGLDGYDPNNNNLTYTVTTDNPNLLQVHVPTGNRSMTIDVQNWGKMTFQLFDHLAKRITDQIVSIAEAGHYNKTDTNSVTFHRVSPNFVIQAGILNTVVPKVQDQFHVDAQHTSAGLLSLAKTSDDDSGTSQFFITDRDTRHLDFNHPVFGMLIEGESVRDGINSVPVTSEVPNSSVVINSVSIFNDTENGLLMLKANEGASGTANVTVTATDTEGNSVQHTFQVTVAADPSNSAPYLQDIPQVRTTVGQQAQFTLQGIDAEGQALYFDAINPTLGTANEVNYQLNIDHNTGVVTVVPPAGFIGKLVVQVGVRNADSSNVATLDKWDQQLIAVDVAPPALGTVDLKPISDSGSNATDNITNTSSMEFDVTGATTGAIVKLYRGNTVVAQKTAEGPTVSFTTTEVSAAGDGTYAITATQTIDQVESDKSTALQVTYDTTAPGAFTSTAPTQATVGQQLSYDAQNPEESTAGFRYEVVGAPDGVSINGTTGVLTWTPAAVGTPAFQIRAIDAAGNVRTQDINLTVAQANAKVAFTLKIVDANGNELTTLSTGQEFFLKGFVQDRRTIKYGVFGAFMDVSWDPAKATTNGPISFGSFFTTQRTGSTSTPGLIDEVGALASTAEPSNPFIPVELFSIPMKATASGGLTFSASPADIFPTHDTVIFRENTAVPTSQINYGTATATVDLSFGAVDDALTAQEGATGVVLDPLANDAIQPGSNDVLTITAVGQTSNGGIVTISEDGKKLIYTPAANFSGTETFTYTIKNQDNETDTATVAVTVQNVNDPPTGVDDTFEVNEDTPNTILDVLQNDSIAPDVGETLKVIAVGAGDKGGLLQIGTGGANIRYTPALNFVGTETFTYTLSDGNGGTDTATVTVTVKPVNDNPTVVADNLTVVEDSSNNTLNVLANDSSAPDTGETLTITAIGATNKGGTVTIAQDGKSLIYTPAANFHGVETFTYTVSDGNGGSATNTVSVNVTNTNDPPTAVADSVQAFKTLKTTFDVLANDSSAPDPAENLVVSAVTQGSNGGTVTIINNGAKIEYQPAGNFTGTETFTYTVRDPGGLTHTATVTVNVLEFIPSHISGFAYIDANNNGVKDAGELPLGGVTVTLSGSATGGNTVSKTVITNADGSYAFRDLAPGTYKLKQSTPAFLVDGKDSPGSAGGAVTANDEITIQLEQDTNAVNYNFGEMGRKAETISISDLFASRSHNYLLVAVDTSTGTQWSLGKGNWRGFTQAKATLVTNSPVSLKLEVTNPQSQPQTATVALPDRRINQIGSQGTIRLYQIIGDPLSFGFTGASSSAATLASSQLAEGEGASTSQSASLLAVDTAFAEGESWDDVADYDLSDDASGAEDAVDYLLAAQADW